MRIVCPSCDAAYDVPASVVEARRTLRCARCSAQFTAIASPHTELADTPESGPERTSEQELALAPAADLRVAKAERLVPPAPPSARGGGKLRLAAVMAAWALSLVLLAGGAWQAITWRTAIMHAWPPSTRLYAALGYFR